MRVKSAPKTTPAPSDIRAALDELGIPFTIKDDEAVALCPYHDDRRAGNFSVNLETGQNFCFSCGGGGGFCNILTAVLGLSYADAARWCRARLRTGQTFAHYEQELTRAAREDTTVHINEASLALFTLPPEDMLLARNLSLSAVDYHGVLWDKSRGMWIIPVREPDTGKLWGWQEKNEHTFRNYPRGLEKSRTLFGIQSLGAEHTAILVESPLDVVRLESAGISGGVSSFGVQVSDDQLEILIRCVGSLVLALDNDQPGMEKTVDLCKTVARLPVSVFNYGDSTAKDPGEMTDDAIQWGIENALPWRAIQEVLLRADPSTASLSRSRRR